MKILGFDLVDNRKGKFAVVDIEKRLREVYIKGDNEACYGAYRAITGASVQESHIAVKPLLKKWEGKTNENN